jgi:hypothetical protein
MGARLEAAFRATNTACNVESMSPRSRDQLLCAVVALAAGLIEPLAEIAWKCRAGFESSEACVWGRSYLPLGRAVGLVVIAPLTFVALLLLRRGWSAWRRRNPTPS